MIETDNNNLAFTGERFIPGVAGALEMEHLHRYWSVIQLCQGKDVLDIACGEGYGSYALSQVAKTVTGVDISSQAVNHAQQKYKHAGLNFLEGSCQSIPAAPHSFDIVISFETLEHMVEHEEFMQEIKRVLKPEGLLIISTPDKYIYSDISNYKNEYHFRELYEDEFNKLIKDNFKNVEILWQEILSGSFLMKEGGSETRTIALFEQEDSEVKQLNRIRKSPYMVALASDQALPKISESALIIPPELGNHLLNVNKDLPMALKNVNVLTREKLGLEELVQDKISFIEELKQENDRLLDKLQTKQKMIEQLISERQNLSAELKDSMPAQFSTHTPETSEKLIKKSGLFDPDFYRTKYPDIRNSGTDPLSHFVQNGYKEKRQPHPLFDPGFYLKKYPQVKESGQNYLSHYLEYGHTARYQPHPLFDPNFYFEKYPEVQARGENPLVHFIQTGASEGKNPNPFFDTAFYLKEYPDVQSSKINPLVHYALYGAKAGYNPSPIFDSNFYIERYSDVNASGYNPLEHYLLNGMKENRRTQPMERQNNEQQEVFF